MDNTIFFERFGLNPDSFVNRVYDQIKTDNGFIYETEEAYRKRICPNCNNIFMNIHSYSWITRKLTSTIGREEELRIKRIRYVCPKCHKTHTFDLEGLKRFKTISDYQRRCIEQEFFIIQSFSTIAYRYQLTVPTIINIFDEYTRIVPRRPMPQYLCIDEKHFEGDSDGKYCVVISDFFSGEVIDVLENRQLPYLDRYFSNISCKERNNVKVFISDMYDGYYSIKKKYFPFAVFAVDLFHVIKLLTTTINKIRINTYKQIEYEDTLEKHFMKTSWKYFLMDERKIYKNEYHSKKYKTYVSYGDIIIRCLKKNQIFYDGYSVLQNLLRYEKHDDYQESERFINWIIAKLNSSGDEKLMKVADSYEKWKFGIMKGLSRNETGRRLSNAIAENNNSHIQKVIDVAYGYRNFKRFRARVMLILTYKKQR